jgi:hypothetical protein
MASSGIFIGLPVLTLVAIRDAALVELTTGVITTSYSDSGTSVSKAITMPAKERFSEACFALSAADSVTYGERTTVIKSNWQNLED